jgi:LmbE family N-acetylglucosaminyl deacetylase
MSTLVIAAHPDDEVLGCGATMASLSKAGEDVRVLILGEGATSRSTKRADSDETGTDVLRAMASEANRLLGVREVAFGALADNRFDSVDLLDIVKLVERYGLYPSLGRSEYRPYNYASCGVDRDQTCWTGIGEETVFV